MVHAHFLCLYNTLMIRVIVCINIYIYILTIIKLLAAYIQFYQAPLRALHPQGTPLMREK
jgi:hypothetical protein